jgi:hypothetical protein
MQIFKTKWMRRYAKREKISDHALREAVERAEQGLIDADLGAGLIKQRVARLGQGRSGGHRMLVAYHSGKRAVFLYGFAKNARSNIEPDELLTLREIGAAWLAADNKNIINALNTEILWEIKDD